MASPSRSVNTAESTNTSIDDAPPPLPAPPYPDRPRSTHHSYHAHHPPPPPHPLGLERKRNYGGPPTSPGRGGVDHVTDREARQQQQQQQPQHPESGRTGYGYGPPSATAPQHQHQQQPGEGEGDSPDLQDADTPGSADGSTAASKRRKTGRGSRGVAHLTPEQLERKRANDREAQRAIRERQRLKTEQYEREIAELKATQPYRELQSVVRQKETVEAELADVKRRMAAIVAMIQPILGVSEGATPAGQPHGQNYGPTKPPTAPPGYNHETTPASTTSPASAGTHGRWQNSLSPVAPTVSIDGQPQQPPEMGPFDQQRHRLVHGLDLGPDRLGLNFLVDPNFKVARIKDGPDGAQDSPHYHHIPMKHDWNGTIAMIPCMQGQPSTQTQSQSPIYAQPPVTSSGMPATSTPFSPAPTASIPTTASGPFATRSTPRYSILPRNCAPTCPLDALLLDFLSERRQRAAEGLSQSEILGPRYPSVSSLLNPAVSAYSHPLSKVFTDILARFPDLATLPERVAVLYVMFLLMRWQVSPTEENYLRLPPWFRPVPEQTAKDHPAWYDHLPFPIMRERLVRAYEEGRFPFDNFFIPFTSTLSLNWPYEDNLVLLASPTSEELMINPVFEQHICMLENWTLGPAFERAFPALVGSFNLKV